MSTPRRRLLALSSVLIAGALACSYSPNPVSGTLGCSSPGGTCPQGYYCVPADNKCWKMGTAPGDGGGGHGGTTDGGRGGTSGSGGGAGGIGGATVDAGSPADKFVHHWVFDSTGVLTQTCPNMPVTNTSLAGDFIDVVPGTTSDLVASYYCPWNLNLVASDKTKASIVAGQSCVTPTTMAGVTINMHGDAFDFTTSDGLSATVSASFTGQYSSPSLTCTFKVTGKLAPMP